MSLVQVRGVRKAFGEHIVLDDVSLDVEEGSVTVFKLDGSVSTQLWGSSPGSRTRPFTCTISVTISSAICAGS